MIIAVLSSILFGYAHLHTWGLLKAIESFFLGFTLALGAIALGLVFSITIHWLLNAYSLFPIAVIVLTGGATPLILILLHVSVLVIAMLTAVAGAIRDEHDLQTEAPAKEVRRALQ